MVAERLSLNKKAVTQPAKQAVKASVPPKPEYDFATHFDELIKARSAEGWARPPSARKGMVVELEIGMTPDGTVKSVTIAKTSGDEPFDISAVAAVKNIGRLTEMQEMKPSDTNRYQSFRMKLTPEDLAL
jgi:colicin import membrane protein